jgi:hypothetical protein
MQVKDGLVNDDKTGNPACVMKCVSRPPYNSRFPN